VKPSLPFFVGEVRRRGERIYRVRASDVPLVIQHGSTDAATLDQAFRQEVYTPSAAAASALDSLGRPPRVLDLGANVGMFSLWVASRWPGAHVVAAEPVPRNVKLLKRNLALQAGAAELHVLEAAVTTRNGTVRFGDGDFTNGRVLTDGGAGSIEVEARDVFPLIGGVDLLKLDIEGGEWPILSDPRFVQQEARVVMLEHHPMGAPAGISPEEAAEKALVSAGYEVERTVTEFPGAGIIWGVRR
jgi:FkbM family methyltransferase